MRHSNGPHNQTGSGLVGTWIHRIASLPNAVGQSGGAAVGNPGSAKCELPAHEIV